jgi:NADPH-dependent 2,4-dienoyl-CoA reductase/sulfur reductase-like enzyme
MSAADLDVAVLGGGPAGRAAAARLRDSDASFALFDEPWPADLTAWPAPVGEAVRIWGLWHHAGIFHLAGLSAIGPVAVTARALIVCTGAAPLPASEATRLLWADHRYDAHYGGWVPILDQAGRTTVAHLYAAGDCTGLGSPAAASGHNAAASALADLALGPHKPASPVTPSTPPPPPPMAILCPCESITAADALAAIAAGATDANQVKAFTRIGMGPCQGRLCAAPLAALLAATDGATASPLTARLPLRPVPTAALLGSFTYADIPVPAAAPI